MRMLGRAMFSLLLAGLAACGGGSGPATMADRQSSQGIAVGEPAPGTLALAGFQNMAREAICTETRNRLFVIDGKQVLRDHAGNCADASYEQVLFSANRDTMLCSHGDTIA